MKPTYHDALAAYGIGSAHPGGMQLTKHMLLHAGLSCGMRVLDAGCGTGNTSAYLASQYGCIVTAADSHPIMIEKAKKRFHDGQLDISAVQCSLESMPFPDESFDVIVSESVLAFTDQALSLPECHRVLKAGGKLLALEVTAETALHKREKQMIKTVYGMKDVNQEQQWLDLLYASGFSNAEVLYSNTVAGELGSYSFHTSDPPEFDMPHSIAPELEEIMNKHHQVTAMLAEQMGFRLIMAVR